MSSLTEHLRETGDHGRLRFHRDCPVCRSERLAGTLPDPAVLSPRLGATLVATALAASASAPTTTALAGGPPAIRESDEPRPPAGARGEDGRPVTADDSGGDREPGAARPDRDDGHGGRGETPPPEPATPTSPAAPSEPAPEEPNRDAAPSRPAHPADPPTSTSPEPAAPQPPAEQATTPSRADAPARGAPAEPTPERGKRSSATPPDASSARSAPGLPERERRAVDSEQRGQAVHVVERGECLWTIAEERLGRDASDAAIAREVTRMWRLNDRRIRSGDPDLIFPGERLEVPRG